MGKKEIYSIAGKLKGHHDSDINGMIDTWENLLVSLDQFKTNIHDIGLEYAEKNHLTTWIVDTSNSTGVFKKEIQGFIESVVAPKCAEIGIKYFFVVLPQSAIAKLSTKNVAKINSGQEGMQTFEVASVDEALSMLQEVKLSS
ncbi:hypothetical protein [Reichenbachiella ulvae]|uniref:Uncharacterized protein n=1 Tax=Reichenbachiella ulvae TaxID=2980104 RepID=A0ABT3CQK4_9BACT|nr:hypothetical protein [Reichenbachiella ulvae]MCV9385764.1 hypothetical protein [Reichenbachiella ulvae]